MPIWKRIIANIVCVFTCKERPSHCVYHFAQLTLRRKYEISRFQSIFSDAKMDFHLEHFDLVKTSLILFVAISLCNANMQSVTTQFTEKKCVATSHTTLQKISKIKCVEKCNQERQKGRCTLAGYNKATKTCYLSVDDPHDVLDSTDDMTGVFFYEPQLTGRINILINKVLLFVNN